LNDIRDVNKLERRFVELIASFKPEFELVSTAISLFSR